MFTPTPTTVRMDTFDAFVSSREFALLHVTRGNDNQILTKIAQYLQVEYPNRFAVGVLDSGVTSISAWWEKRFPKAFLRPHCEGYHLFYQGKHSLVPIGVRAPDQAEALTMLVGAFVAPRGLKPFSDDKLMNAIVADVNSYVATADKLYPGNNAAAR